jgi:hypothetical protein
MREGALRNTKKLFCSMLPSDDLYCSNFRGNSLNFQNIFRCNLFIFDMKKTAVIVWIKYYVPLDISMVSAISDKVSHFLF